MVLRKPLAVDGRFGPFRAKGIFQAPRFETGPGEDPVRAGWAGDGLEVAGGRSELPLIEVGHAIEGAEDAKGFEGEPGVRGVPADEVDARPVGERVWGKEPFAAMESKNASDAGFPVDLVQCGGSLQQVKNVSRVAEEIAET